MGFFFTFMVITFLILLIVNIVFFVANLIFLVSYGLQALLQDMNFIERIQFSVYFKWIVLSDLFWLATAIGFMLKRKQYRTNPEDDYLKYNPIENPKICVTVIAYNEELAIGKVVNDFKNQKSVESVIVVDNHSIDKTVEIAKENGATIITKEKNMGFAHSCVIGLKKALETNANVIVFVEGDGSSNGYDLKKMMTYLDHCDMVVGTRLIQTLSEKGNQVKMMYVWGNFLMGKLIQIKFFSLSHMGNVSLTDVGCMLRVFRRDALEKIIDKFTDPITGEVIVGNEVALLMIIEALKKNLKIIEIPVSSNRRIGQSKIGSDKKFKAIKLGINNIWHIISS